MVKVGVLMEKYIIKIALRKEKLKSWCVNFLGAILIMFFCLRYELDVIGFCSMLFAVFCLLMIIITFILLLLKK